jgi:SAM-dependent methyltransferase
MTTPVTDIVAAYDACAVALAERYETVLGAAVHAPLSDLLPSGPGLLALDVGAGSGRDAVWLSSRGFDVVAVEPAAGMRAEGQRRHSDKPVRWLDDRLPDLSVVHRLGLSFDAILLSAVWMHVPPPDRPRAFRKLVTLLKPGGTLLMSLRTGPPDPDRPMWDTPNGEVEALARMHGLAVIRSVTSPDRLERPEVNWTSFCLRLPDDGAGALPLLRGIILNDAKTSTYKLALLRAVARIADTAPALAIAQASGDDVIELPLGLVALNWVRMYLPLVSAGLPQAPGNAGPNGLGFAKEGFRALSRLGISSQDLRIAARFSGERATAVRLALVEARRTIAEMPVNFTRYPNSEARVFEAALLTPSRGRSELMLDAQTLRASGTLFVPGHVWRALQRLGAWVEPVLLTEWARLVRAYGERMGRIVAPGEVEAALIWLDPARDTALARTVAQSFIEKGRTITCVWTGARLTASVLDIDHCLPWSAWPCGDLWNLMPATRRVNQHSKRDRLPSAAALASAREAIIGWWDDAWRTDAALRDRFDREVTAALPVPSGAASDDIFAALEWRRLRLRQDQQIEEWAGVRPDAGTGMAHSSEGRSGDRDGGVAAGGPIPETALDLKHDRLSWDQSKPQAVQQGD